MSLKDLDLRNQYRSDRHKLLEDFYVPCLERSLTYDRAVGFFSSTSLTVAAKGVSALIRVGGRMRLIASPHLSQEDADAIAQGLKQREEVIEAALVRELAEVEQLQQRRDVLEAQAKLTREKLKQKCLSVLVEFESKESVRLINERGSSQNRGSELLR